MSGPTPVAVHHGCTLCDHTKKEHRKSGCWAEVWNGEDYGFCGCQRYVPKVKLAWTLLPRGAVENWQ